MSANGLIIQQPSVDFGTFLALAQQALGFSPSAKIDACPVERSDAERFLACLAEMKHENVTPNLTAHVSYSVLVIADDHDMLDILSVCGMPFVAQDTTERGVQLAVITGTQQQWRDAVKSGSARERAHTVRAFFNHLMSLFDASMCKDYDSHTLPDKTRYLTYKR
jgi:hypothetical protein